MKIYSSQQSSRQFDGPIAHSFGNALVHCPDISSTWYVPPYLPLVTQSNRKKSLVLVPCLANATTNCSLPSLIMVGTPRHGAISSELNTTLACRLSAQPFSKQLEK